MKISVLPAKEWLEELFEYRPEEGLFWKLRPQSHFKSEVDWYIWNKRFARKPAGKIRPWRTRRGTRRKDHCNVQVPMSPAGGPIKQFAVHRVAFAMMGVEIPEGKIIDHWDKDPWNNRWSNLRLATHVQNSHNHSGWRRRKNNLPKGVYVDSKPRKVRPYFAMLKVGSKYERFPYRETVQQALDDYLKRAAEVHQEFMVTRSE